MPLVLKTPLDGAVKEALSAISQTAADTHLNYLLIGAAARDILLGNVWGLNTGTATRDQDFAFALKSWKHFQELKMALSATGRLTADPRSPHRMIFTSSDGLKIPLDLVPYGDLEVSPGTIEWPDEDGRKMVVTGLKEAHAHALNLKIGKGRFLRVASIPSLVALKILAWHDRKYSGTHDASDIHLFLKSYHEAGNEDRLYDSEFSILQACGHDPVLAGAQLLGADVRRIHQNEAGGPITAILGNQAEHDELIRQMVTSQVFAEEEQEKINSLFKKFQIGFNSTL